MIPEPFNSPDHHIRPDNKGRVGEHVRQVGKIFFQIEIRLSDVKISNSIRELDRAPSGLVVERSEHVCRAAELPIISENKLI